MGMSFSSFFSGVAHVLVQLGIAKAINPGGQPSIHGGHMNVS